jgi:hypothetical protein
MPANPPQVPLEVIQAEAVSVEEAIDLLAKQHEAMGDVMMLRRLSATPHQREMAEKAIEVWREVEAFFAHLQETADHHHCANGCEKAVAVQSGERLVCARCGGDWVRCGPEICDLEEMGRD